MDGSFDDFYKANVGLVKKVSLKVYARFSAMGAGMEYADVEQEAVIVMMKAWRGFDPTRGWKFSTYYINSAWNAFNRLAEGFSREMNVIGVYSMDANLDSDGESANWESLTDGGHATPEQLFEAKELLSEIEAVLSPLASKIVELMLDPPEQMQQEWEQRCDVMGLTRADMTLGFVTSYLGALTNLPSCEFTKATKEIGNLKKVFNV